jgi:two-component system cell cycle response regulator DivK
MAKLNRKHRILLIEDDNSVRELFSTLLERSGYEVVEADYALPAMFRAVHFTPDLILTDLRMPMMNGLELIEQFKGHAETKDIPVVVVSGSASDADREAAFEAGCAGYISKPIDASHFARQVAAYLPVG